MKYEVFDTGGSIPWFTKLDGTFLVDPLYLDEFLKYFAMRRITIQDKKVVAR